MTPERYRAYEASTGKNSKLFRNTVTGEVTPRVVASWDTEEIQSEGALTDGKAVFDAGDTKITRVVFLSGEDDVVCGCVTVDASGSISVECPSEETGEEVPL